MSGRGRGKRSFRRRNAIFVEIKNEKVLGHKTEQKVEESQHVYGNTLEASTSSNNYGKRASKEGQQGKRCLNLTLGVSRKEIKNDSKEGDSNKENGPAEAERKSSTVTSNVNTIEKKIDTCLEISGGTQVHVTEKMRTQPEHEKSHPKLDVKVRQIKEQHISEADCLSTTAAEIISNRVSDASPLVSHKKGQENTSVVDLNSEKTCHRYCENKERNLSTKTDTMTKEEVMDCPNGIWNNLEEEITWKKRSLAECTDEQQQSHFDVNRVYIETTGALNLEQRNCAGRAMTGTIGNAVASKETQIGETSTRTETSKMAKSQGATPQMSSLRLNSNTSTLEKDGEQLRQQRQCETRSDNGQHLRQSETRRSSNNEGVQIRASDEKENTHLVSGVSSTSNANSSQGSNQSLGKAKKIHATLEHSATCLDAKCQITDCYTLKQFFVHNNSCDKGRAKGCMICFAFDAIVCQHSKGCKMKLDMHCPIPNCNKIKSKVVEEWMILRKKHNHLMRVVFVILSHARLCDANQCQLGNNCKKMKSVLQHSTKCPKKSGCPSKKFLFSLCKNHNDICVDPNCPVDFCRDKWGKRDHSSINRELPNDPQSTSIAKHQNTVTEQEAILKCQKEIQLGFETTNGQAQLETETVHTKYGIASERHMNDVENNLRNKKHSTTANSNEMYAEVYTREEIPTESQIPPLPITNDIYKKPYSFGDHRQLPLYVPSQNEALPLEECSYFPHYNTKSFEMMPYTNTNMYQNMLPVQPMLSYNNIQSWTNTGIECNIHHVKNAEWSLQHIQPPKDYASAYGTEDGLIEQGRAFRHDCFPMYAKSYTLWPANSNNELRRLSPTQMQRILMGKDITREGYRDTMDIKERSGEKKGRGIQHDDVKIPTKRILLEQDRNRMDTPHQLAQNGHDKTMTCVRRLFPSSNADTGSPKDSESDSDFCKHLSQDSGSENGEWVGRPFLL